MEYTNYLGVSQLYSLMDKVTSNNTMITVERILHLCDDSTNRDTMINDVLNQGIDINYRLPASDFFRAKMPHLIGSTLLHLAAEKHDIRMFKYFIKLGADFTIKNGNQFTVVHQMAYKSNYKKYFDSVTLEGKLEQDPFIKSVLSAHIEYQNSSNPCDRNGMSHFSVACMTNNVKSVEFFLDHGVSVNEAHKGNSRNSTGYTPLYFAVKYCAAEVAEILVKRGADLTAKDSKGRTALQLLVEEKMKIWSKRKRMMSLPLSDKLETYTDLIALFQENEKITKMLLDNYSGSEEDNATDINFTGFHAVCTMQDTSMVEHFLHNKVVDFERAIDFDSTFCPGYTALHFAAHFNADAVKLLMKNGARVDVKDAKGVTPFDICMRTFKVEDVHGIMQLHEDCSSITFLNGKTKLSDFIYAMRESDLFEDYLRNNVASMYTYVSLDSKICAGYAPLHLAVACTESCPNRTNRVLRSPRYFERIATCLRLGADVTAENGDGLTSVHQAVRLCENQVVLYLLHRQGTLFNPVDGNGLSHFHAACLVSHVNFVEKLISIPYPENNPSNFPLNDPNNLETSSRVDIDSPIKTGFRWYKENSICEYFVADGSTPLHLVADIGDISMMKLLTNHNANVLAKDGDGSTAVVRADEARRLEKKICSYSATVKLYDQFVDLLKNIAISQATANNNSNDFNALYKIFSRIPSNDYIFGSFIKDDEKRCNRIVVNRRILKCFFKKMGITMLHLICYTNSYEQIRDKLDDGVDVNVRVKNDSPFYPGCTPLHFAVLYQRLRLANNDVVFVDIVNLLLERGADVSISNCNRQTPIHQSFNWFSCRANPPDIMTGTLIVNHKDFSINPQDDSGISHFHMACLTNRKGIVQEFIKKGVNVNQSVSHFSEKFGGYTPLHFAMIQPSCSTCSLLLQHGVDVNAKDRLGNTPLHVAVKYGKWSSDEVFSIVLRAGADPNAKNIMHETPLEILLDKETIPRTALAHFISHGARVNIVNPLTHESYLSKAISSTGQSIFDEIVKSQDIMNVDENGFTAIHNIVRFDAIYWGRYRDADARESIHFVSSAEAIEMLTNLNLDIDSQDRNGMTALHIAVKNRNFSGIAGLLMNGADINVTDASGDTPFTYIWEFCKENAAPTSDKLKSFDLKIFHFLAKHVHKLMFAQIYVSKDNQAVYVEARKKFYLDNTTVYKAELKDLENSPVDKGAIINLRHFLSETGVVGSYPHIMQPLREEIHRYFEKSVKKLHEQFPVMASLLKLQYRKALARAQLVSDAAESWNLLLEWQFPVLCADVLMRYVTNQDLKNVIATTDLI